MLVITATKLKGVDPNKVTDPASIGSDSTNTLLQL